MYNKLTGHLVSALLGHQKRTPILARFSLVVFFETKRHKTRMKAGVRRSRRFASWSASQSPFRQRSPRESQGVPGSPRESLGAKKCVASDANAYPICDVASVANAYPICDVASVANASPICDVVSVANAYPICDMASDANAYPIWCKKVCGYRRKRIRHFWCKYAVRLLSQTRLRR